MLHSKIKYSIAVDISNISLDEEVINWKVKYGRRSLDPDSISCLELQVLHKNVVDMWEAVTPKGLINQKSIAPKFDDRPTEML